MSGAMPIAAWRLVTPAQNATIGASHQETAVAPSGVQAVLIEATGDCHIRIGPNAVAVSTDTLIRSAYPPLVFRVSQGDLVSVIQDASATGTLYATWLTH